MQRCTTWAVLPRFLLYSIVALVEMRCSGVRCFIDVICVPQSSRVPRQAAVSLPIHVGFSS